MSRIGILGASGSAGKGAADVLKGKDGIELKLGCRHIETLSKETENVELCSVDIERKNELDDFVKNCDCVINCAGPSWKIKGSAAEACFHYQIPYIDVAGGNSFINDLNSLNNVDKNTGITSAGVYPGLSELFLKWVCTQTKEEILSVQEIFFGNDELSDVAIEDICMSLKEGEGEAFCYCHNGNIEKISFETKASVKIPGVSTPVYLLPVVNPAFANIIGSLNIEKAVFYMGLMKAEGMTQLINLKKELENSKFEAIFSEDMKNIFYDKNCRNGFGIAVDVITITGEHIKYVLSGESNWNYLTGCVAALTALNRKGESLKGIRYVHEATDAKEVIAELKERGFITVKKFVKRKSG